MPHRCAGLGPLQKTGASNPETLPIDRRAEMRDHAGMMKNLFAIVALIMVVASPTAAQDFDKGWETYMTAFGSYDFGHGNAYSYIITIITMSLAVFYIRMLYKRGEVGSRWGLSAKYRARRWRSGRAADDHSAKAPMGQGGDLWSRRCRHVLPRGAVLLAGYLQLHA
jgi:hypothetical protein